MFKLVCVTSWGQITLYWHGLFTELVSGAIITNVPGFAFFPAQAECTALQCLLLPSVNSSSPSSQQNTDHNCSFGLQVMREV